MLVFDSFGQIGTWRRWKCDPKLSWYESMMGQDQLCKQFRKCHHLGPRYDFFLQKKISDLLLTRQSNICRKKQIFVFNIMLIVWASLFFNHLCGGQRVSFGGNSVSRHTEKVENTHLLGPGVKFFSSSNARKNSFFIQNSNLAYPGPWSELGCLPWSVYFLYFANSNFYFPLS